MASATVEQFRQVGWCEKVQASGETTNTCRRVANAAPAWMRAPQACSSSPLTNNNTSHSRASSMHLPQCFDRGSVVAWLPRENLLAALEGLKIAAAHTPVPAI